MRFYITTTLPYVNADPHIGFAMEIIRADIIARFKRLQGYEVFFNTGTDEHGINIYKKALAKGVDPQTFVDEYAKHFKDLIKALDLSPDINFIRTTDLNHIKAAKDFWKIVRDAGFIYKKNYKMKYCAGCELEKTNSELEKGRCPLHPSTELEIIEEENYFFKFSEFQNKLLDFYHERDDFVIPDFRFNEIKAFVGRGLEDFSISRLKNKMPWGIEVPDDPEHVMYVWFDALINYISAIGWPDDKEKFNKWWIEPGGVVQYCGKDNLRQQAAMWQAMLMAANLPPSKHIIINGFIISGGKKMSKTLGNVIDPFAIVSEYGADSLRYYVAREFHPFEDSDITMERFKDTYNANLANGLGNLISRIMKMAEANLEIPVKLTKPILPVEYIEGLESFEIKKAMDLIWNEISIQDAYIQETKPFSLIKTDPAKAKEIITHLVQKLDHIAYMLLPIMPSTAAKIKELILSNKAPIAPLFPRK